ncbi:porimin isoform X5 [Tympanuchus pallidicinctus]|uniref:porimin isoform X5 n=1 Tax=Tympanuchus pallidicinctus TaxID=109042 RepID=UPI002286FD4E|nr:porimin isoform X5 [Tympanuchus pallidicinctus]
MAASRARPAPPRPAPRGQAAPGVPQPSRHRAAVSEAMRLFPPGAACALRALALLLLLGPLGNAFAEVNVTNTSSNATSPHVIQENSTLSNSSAVPSTQSAAGTPTSASRPTSTAACVTVPVQPAEANQTRSTTASSVTSSQANVTVTTSKISFTSVTATSKSETVIARASRFDVGSFVGGIVLTLCVLVILYIGCKTYHSRRGIQYRTIDEHDAII